MFCLKWKHIVLLVIYFLVVTVTLGQVTAPQLLFEMIRPIRVNMMRYERPEMRAHQQEVASQPISRFSPATGNERQSAPSSISNDQGTSYSSQQLVSLPSNQETASTSMSNTQSQNHNHIRHAFKVAFGEQHGRHAKLENVFNTLDRLAYTISKPAVILNAVRLFSMVVSSLFMSVFMVPANGFHESSQKELGRQDLNQQQQQHRVQTWGGRPRGRAIWTKVLDQLNRSDVEGMIELITRNYDESLERASLMDKLLCRDRDRYRRSR